MIRRIFSLVLIAALFASCGNSGKKDGTAKEAVTVEGVEIVKFESLAESPDNYVGRNIVVEGKVVHVCTVSGKKLFIVGENPDVRLFIAAGENMPKFPMDLLGSQVTVEGTITKAGGAPEVSGEKHAAMMAEGAAKPMASDTCETETALAKQSSLANIIMDYKSHSVK